MGVDFVFEVGYEVKRSGRISGIADAETIGRLVIARMASRSQPAVRIG